MPDRMEMLREASERASWFRRHSDMRNPEAFIRTDLAYFGQECAAAIANGTLLVSGTWPDQEAVERASRIIDPKAWERRVAHLNNATEERWRSGHPHEDIARSMREAAYRLADEVVAPSLIRTRAALTAALGLTLSQEEQGDG